MSGHSQNAGTFKVALNLTVACIISGLIIAIVYAVTNPAAEVQREEMKNRAMRDLVPKAESFQAVEGKTGWSAAVHEGKIIAYEVPVESKGYGGAIKMIVAVDNQSTVIGYTILSHNETPGLGDNATKQSFKSQFCNKTLNELEDKNGNPLVVKVADKVHVQALTGATITSKAVVRAVAEAVKEVEEFKNAGKKVQQ